MGWEAERQLPAVNSSKRTLDVSCARRSLLVPRSYRRQALNYPAICDQTASTLVDHPVQFRLERNQVLDFSLNFLPVLLCDRIDRGAGLRTIVSELEKLPDLIKRETEITRAPNEAQPIKVILLVGTIVAFGAVGLRQEAAFLVEPDRFDFGTGLPRKMADRQS